MYQFLGIIQKKEQTGASIFGDTNERIFGGEIGDVVVRNEQGKAIVLKSSDWESYQASIKKPTKKVESEKQNV